MSYATMRGYRFPALLQGFVEEYGRGVGHATTAAHLRRILELCRTKVPYYSELLRGCDEKEVRHASPQHILSRLPVLTKQIIRERGEDLVARDLRPAKWHYNTSGGSTGEPVRLVQDTAYDDRSKAITLFYNLQMGCDVGAPVVRLWGSERDIEGTTSVKAGFFNWLTSTTWLNAFRMSRDRMRHFIDAINRIRPSLIVAYVQAIYELAGFAEEEGLRVIPQRGIVASAGTLYPFMRERISRVFGCPVYNCYGSREVSTIASEIPGSNGLWVAPWGNFVEIVDDFGKPVPPGDEGNILVTCLTNEVMPLVRYAIGDRGALLPESLESDQFNGQVLKRVSGRNVDVFRTRDQTLVDGEYFTHLLYFRPWVASFQVVQKHYEKVLFRVVLSNTRVPAADLEEIKTKTRLVMGAECQVDFEFTNDLPALKSGKYRYTISELCEVT